MGLKRGGLAFVFNPFHVRILGCRIKATIKGWTCGNIRGIKKTRAATQIDKPRERKPRARKKRKEAAAARDLEQELSLILEFFFSSSQWSCLNVPN